MQQYNIVYNDLLNDLLVVSHIPRIKSNNKLNGNSGQAFAFKFSRLKKDAMQHYKIE